MRGKGKRIACPYCSNKRLFDLTEEGTGTVSIKCPGCKRVVVIPLQNNNTTRKIIC
ncbi:hypothetical protein [uncultured Clostridium sp.]|uniref:hypothetical protein n=1 Tax=uncultured Clostridium sp. TaxID=59620 RepID=UPI0025FE64FC|nr:hypothetical protein [uncultured Clostridium sp.]